MKSDYIITFENNLEEMEMYNIYNRSSGNLDTYYLSSTRRMGIFTKLKIGQVLEIMNNLTNK